MTFELRPETQVLQERARAIARATVQPQAACIDEVGEVGADLRWALEEAALWPSEPADALAIAVVLEEIAVASAATALALGLAQAIAGLDAGVVAETGGLAAVWPGLRGAEAARARMEAVLAAAPPRARGRALTRVRLTAASVAVGIGRAGIEEALAHLRESGARPSGTPEEPPHWVLADAATEVEAARLATLRAALSSGATSESADASTALLLAAGAAEHAVDAALRIIGPPAYQKGTVIERLTRDAKAIGLVLGSVDAQRMALADEILPR